ncbi:MAG TPA: diguanylate cyclase [Devosia sp.]|nr:diguanylate cyclase [Devosia sp.]
MSQHWPSLIANLAVVALVMSAWVHGQFVFARRPRALKNAAFGLVTGLGAIASMSLSIQIEPGALFDLRSSLLALAGFFGGPVSAVIAVAIAVSYRLSLGGAASAGAIGIVTMAALGLLVSFLARRRIRGIVAAIALSLCVGIVSILLANLPGHQVTPRTLELTLPVAVMNALATMLTSFFLMRQASVERERDLLRAAFIQSQDLRYVKGVDGRYVAVNFALARVTGLNSPDDMVGRTDREVLAPQLANGIMIDDQRLLSTGEGFAEREEQFETGHGPAWYETSKVALRNDDGEIVGLTGVTRDISARKQLEERLRESRDQMGLVLSEMSEGVAMFDGNGVLAYCNAQYRRLFPLTAASRTPGATLASILEAVAATGEQRGIPAERKSEWVAETAATLNASGDQDIELFDGRWISIRTRPTSDGSALVVASDISRIKEAEQVLLSMTERLKVLATTDGLTSLVNRRAFDESLDAELLRCRRADTPLSLLLVDVDRFKSYNDRYGHPAGDDVLRNVGHCLQGALRRPGDIAARYGGEEFVAILPGTTEDGALFIADGFREALHRLGIRHEGGDKGFVTASVGVATVLEWTGAMSGAEMVALADSALYAAKRAGRDRIVAWGSREMELASTRRGHLSGAA